MQTTLFDTDATLGAYLESGGSMDWHEYASALLTDEWQCLSTLRDACGNVRRRYWIHTALVHLAQYGLIEESWEQIERHGHPCGFKTLYRRKQ